MCKWWQVMPAVLHRISPVEEDPQRCWGIALIIPQGVYCGESEAQKWVCNLLLAQCLAWELHWAPVSVVGLWVSLQMLSFNQDFPQPVGRRHSTPRLTTAFLCGFEEGSLEEVLIDFCFTELGFSMQVMSPIGIISQPFHPFDDLLWQHCGAVLRWDLYIPQSWKTWEVLSTALYFNVQPMSKVKLEIWVIKRFVAMLSYS